MDQFSEFLNKEVIDRKCEIHNVNYWRISIPISHSDKRKSLEFCPKCSEEEKRQKEISSLEESGNRVLYQTTYNVLMRDSMIPKELENASFDNFIAETSEEKQLLAFAKQQVNKYLQGEKGNTLITGSTGVGKSHLSVSMAKYLNEQYRAKNEPKSVLFISFTDLVTKIQSGWQYQKTNFTQEYAVNLLTKVDYLFIDDLGAKNAEVKAKSDWEQDLLFQVLNNRENTIINTNLSSSELQKVYNQRNYSRIIKGLDGNSFKVQSIKDKRYSINKMRGDYDR